MNWLARKQADQSRLIANESLESMLFELQKSGDPRLGRYGRGWHCDVEMRVESTGVTFKVASEFGLETPMDAASQCLARVRDVLSKQVRA